MKTAYGLDENTPQSLKEWREFLQWMINVDRIYLEGMVGWKDNPIRCMYLDFKVSITRKRQALKSRGVILEVLDDYSKFLEDHGYTDTDWRTEEPLAIDKFMKERKTKIDGK